MLDVHIHIKSEYIPKLKMVGNQTLVEVFDHRLETKSGIKLLNSNDAPFVPDRGVVRAVPESDVCFNIGDCVIIKKYKGKRILSDDNRQFILLDSEFVLCILEGDLQLLKDAGMYANQEVLQSET